MPAMSRSSRMTRRSYSLCASASRASQSMRCPSATDAARSTRPFCGPAPATFSHLPSGDSSGSTRGSCVVSHTVNQLAGSMRGQCNGWCRNSTVSQGIFRGLRGRAGVRTATLGVLGGSTRAAPRRRPTKFGSQPARVVRRGRPKSPRRMTAHTPGCRPGRVGSRRQWALPARLRFSSPSSALIEQFLQRRIIDLRVVPCVHRQALDDADVIGMSPGACRAQRLARLRCR